MSWFGPHGKSEGITLFFRISSMPKRKKEKGERAVGGKGIKMIKDRSPFVF